MYRFEHRSQYEVSPRSSTSGRRTVRVAATAAVDRCERGSMPLSQVASPELTGIPANSSRALLDAPAQRLELAPDALLRAPHLPLGQAVPRGDFLTGVVT